MKTTALLILLFFLTTSCGKEKTNEEPKGIYHELKTGNKCTFYYMSYVRKDSYSSGLDSIGKISVDLYTLKNFTKEFLSIPYKHLKVQISYISLIIDITIKKILWQNMEICIFGIQKALPQIAL